MSSVSGVSPFHRFEENTQKTWRPAREKTIPRALEIIKKVGWILLNIITLGLCGPIYNALKKRKIEKQTKQNIELKTTLQAGGNIPDDRIDLLKKRFETLVTQIAAAQKAVNAKRGQLDRLNGGAVSSGNSQTALNQVLDELRPALQKLCEENEALDNECKSLEKGLRGYLEDEKNLRLEFESVRKEKLDPIGTLQALRGETRKRLSDAQQTLTDLETGLKQINDKALSYTPVPARYQVVPGDPHTIKGDFESPKTPYARSFNGISTMPELLGKALEESVHELLKESDRYNYEQLRKKPPPHNARDVHFSLSPEYYQLNPTHEALFQLAALRLIEGARLSGDPEDAMLIFNDQKLQVQWSRPHRSPSGKEGDVMLYHNRDFWTPEPGKPPYMGVDPVSVKRIWHKLNAQERSYLETLILKPFMLDNNPRLQAAETFADSARGGLVKVAYELLCDIGAALKDAKEKPTIKSQNALLLLLDDDDAVPFLKPNKVEVEDTAPFVPWQFDVEALESHADLFIAVLNTQNILRALSNNMSKALLNPRRNITMRDGDVLPNEYNLEQISRQYYTFHYYKYHGCLFGALGTMLFQNKPKEEGGRFIKSAMAVYLDTHREFDEKINVAARYFP